MAVKNRNNIDLPIPTLNEIELTIADFYDIRKNIIIPNISYGFDYMHECDIFILKPSGYCTEIEIKRSISDLKADFKKKHTHKDNRIKNFYYCIPEQLIEKALEIIPKDAGILECYFSGKLRCRIYRESVSNKEARKLTEDEKVKLMRLAYMRIWSMKKKLARLENVSNKSI